MAAVRSDTQVTITYTRILKTQIFPLELSFHVHSLPSHEFEYAYKHKKDKRKT